MRNVVNSVLDLVQIMNMSSMYLLISGGWMGCVFRNSFRIMDLNMLAIVGEKVLPLLFL